ncbi:MAG TPA: NADPH-dependent F420 reductase [Acidimicrobiales bacterium]|nr:NADPH-dependent F420 reductase [Acidimicrobiales bacterium]
MRVGIVGGTGAAGGALASRLAAGGCEVMIGSRALDRAADSALALRSAWPEMSLAIEGSTNEDACECDVVVLATPWEGAVATALDLADRLEGRTLVSMVNALGRMGAEFQALVPARGSIAATVQAVIPKVRVTAAFQHLPARELGDLSTTLECDVLVCADDPVGAEETIALVNTMHGLRAVHCGSLASANAVEALTAVLLNVNIRHKSHVSLRLAGLKAPSQSVAI